MKTETREYPWRPRCTNYFNPQFTGRSDRCPQPAVADLHAPDGTRVPGGPICWWCASNIITEYRLLLDENWSVQPITVKP